jgi:colanic acid/amylovoran biosynthesis glycosyltransferase
MIYFKLKSFPHFSETFITSNLVYAKEHSYKLKIIVNSYLGIQNSSQKKILEKYKIEEDIIKPLIFSKNKLKKTIQVLSVISNPRVFFYYLKFCFCTKKINLKMLNALHQFKHFKNNLVHIHFNSAIEPIIDLSKLGYINPVCIVTFHGYDAFLSSPQDFKKKYLSFYKNHVKAVTVNSHYLKQTIIQLGVSSNLISVIPIGIDTRLFNSSKKNLLKKKTLQLITVGRLIQLKGHEYAVKAVKKLKELNYDVEYTIVGDGHNFKIIEDLIKDYKLEKVIKLKGKLSQNMIVKVLRSSDVFLMPTTFDDRSKRREAFGLVSLEAQAMGLPVIGFNSGGFPETLINRKTGFLVEDRNVDGLVDKIIYLINRPKEFEQMSENAISHAKNFDFEHTMQKYLDLYETLN